MTTPTQSGKILEKALLEHLTSQGISPKYSTRHFPDFEWETTILEAKNAIAVSYTHLTLPTNREV